ncbi:aconitase family protein [Aminivibrio sp.]|uniref:aconitase family protein n=1 Tax=Aminivibrio sp. TaxID=1872489 RepID=UPI003D97E700
MLHLIGKIGSDGADYLALSFCGDTVQGMSLSERMTLSNMAIECGAKAGLMEADDKTAAHLRACWEKAKVSQHSTTITRDSTQRLKFTHPTCLRR